MCLLWLGFWEAAWHCIDAACQTNAQRLPWARHEPTGGELRQTSGPTDERKWLLNGGTVRFPRACADVVTVVYLPPSVALLCLFISLQNFHSSSFFLSVVSYTNFLVSVSELPRMRMVTWMRTSLMLSWKTCVRKTWRWVLKKLAHIHTKVRNSMRCLSTTDYMYLKGMWEKNETAWFNLKV